ncbi:MAG TPA: hypothetical protein VME63_00725 [Dyella sp.]|uniref:hypothetical protein n=1 Tax=Dyella sp. TaxID=1869338 RepID=UPI002C740764|nr:hypothetical protein [Dyella sp.]HTV83900.1 hypothetical protein [Dyella sp.]
MSPRMWFTLVLRYLGASEIFSGLNYFVTAYNVHTGNYASSASALAFVNHGVASAAVGLVVVLGAAQLSALVVSALPAKQAEPAQTEPSNV